MRIALLIPGTGSYFCGSCLRDDALTLALRARGHEVRVLPLYLPLVREAVPQELDEPIHLGGINLYLQQRFPWLRRMPPFLQRLLDHPRLLALASRRGAMTEAADLGELTLATLRGRDGPLAALFQKLVEDLEQGPLPEVFLLSNVMLSGIAPLLRERFGLPIACTLQGELPFLEALPRLDHDAALEVITKAAAAIDAFHAVSHFHAEWTTRELGLDRARVHVVHNGIPLADFQTPATPDPAHPVLGFLARMCRDKGIHTLVEAYLLLARRGHEQLRLAVAGVELPPDRVLLNELKARLVAEGLGERVEFQANITRQAKLAFLRKLTVFSVPATYGESFGLYVLEALATGVPVVQPRHGAFPEILEATGGGLLVAPDDPRALADGIEGLLLHPELARAHALRGRNATWERFSVERMAAEVDHLLTSLAQPSAKRASAAIAN